MGGCAQLGFETEYLPFEKDGLSLMVERQGCNITGVEIKNNTDTPKRGSMEVLATDIDKRTVSGWTCGIPPIPAGGIGETRCIETLRVALIENRNWSAKDGVSCAHWNEVTVNVLVNPF
jgi:hypothetical protein